MAKSTLAAWIFKCTFLYHVCIMLMFFQCLVRKQMSWVSIVQLHIFSMNDLCFCKHKTHTKTRSLTGSWRGVQLHFLRRLSLFLIGHWRPAPASEAPPPISRARAAASVARLWRSKVSMSSPARRQIIWGF